MLFDTQLRAMLASARRIAIIGAKDNPGAPVEHVGRYLLNAGYEITIVY